MIVHFNRHFNLLGEVFFLNIHIKIVAFVLNLAYIALFAPSLGYSGGPRKKAFASIFLDINHKCQSIFFEKVAFFRSFLRVKSGFLGFLNTALPFQHRNKMGFLCVT